MPKRVTLKDIAEKMAVSQNTVSVALRGEAGVSDQLRDQILAVARELGYAPKHVSARPSVLICSTVENFSDTYFFSDMHRLLREKIKVRGGKAVSLNLDSSYSRMDINQIIRQNNTCAVVLLGDSSEQIVSYFAETGLPVLCCSFFCPTILTDVVIEDNFSGIYQLVKHLYEHNYRQLGFIGNPDMYFAFFERLMCFRSICEHFSLVFDPSVCICDYPLDGPMSIRYMKKRLAELPYMPEAFLCADDRTAVLTIKALTELHYAVPRDIAVTGFDNSELSRLSTPTVTTIDTEIELQAEAAVARLWEKIRSRETEDGKCERLVLPVTFISGDSVDLSHKITTDR
ncbi:LacI family transcriptional regulator [Butyricicoccus faecihominis]|uniref:LacI family DNA-binding transcriptional regulator n=1 Tax=Butyricicoccaceae TaxID=3085642 RepID=UPI002478D241|nr:MULTISPECIES: LacI family DNA-binding transcriptional regulator [Butyricicoccaceae]MCQ5129282.1 LacI family transcriptional regulator [Butyricicoccus faecihominis]WNX84997.1 LacI family DNA-binding transcriptional regulator [Agathobaculum sp. NTUH-O15-33]